MQPTGNLHLGNYLRSLKKFCFSSKRNEVYILRCRLTCYNSISKPNELQDNVLETVASFIATGLNPIKV